MLTIIGMKMPENCEECRLSVLIKDDAYCTAMSDEPSLLYEDDWPLRKPERCPLVDLLLPKYCGRCGKEL